MATIWRARAVLAVGGVNCLHTTYWNFGAVAPSAGATEALARVRAFFNSGAALISSGSTLTLDPVLGGIDDNTGTLIDAAVGTLPAAVTFSASGDPLPRQVQFLHRYSTGAFVNGRALRGRSFIPGPNEAQNASNAAPLSASVTAWNTALGLLGTTVVSAIDQVIWHRPTDALPGSSSPVTGRSCSTSWATLRGRVS